MDKNEMERKSLLLKLIGALGHSFNEHEAESMLAVFKNISMCSCMGMLLHLNLPS